MKYPLWILNSILFALCFGVLLFSLFSRQTIPERIVIQAISNAKPVEEKASEISIDKIYQEDLFNTYIQEKDTTKPGSGEPMPEPPTPKPVTIPEEPKPAFLEPLPITLKGIVFFYLEEGKNRAVIANTQTKKERSFKVGDMIQDAQLIRIFNNKVIFLRPNGQQEILYLRKKDAEHDPEYASLIGWKNVAQQLSDFMYAINMRELTDRIGNLAQLIDLLDLTTVYKQGVSIGCRIGVTKENSLAVELGLQSGDIILSINDIPATTAENRLAIYKQVMALKTKDIISVNLIRDNREITMRYALESPKVDAVVERDTTMSAPDTAKILKERHTFAPTLREIRARERNNMIQKGRAPTKGLTSHFAE